MYAMDSSSANIHRTLPARPVQEELKSKRQRNSGTGQRMAEVRTVEGLPLLRFDTRAATSPASLHLSYPQCPVSYKRQAGQSCTHLSRALALQQVCLLHGRHHPF